MKNRNNTVIIIIILFLTRSDTTTLLLSAEMSLKRKKKGFIYPPGERERDWDTGAYKHQFIFCCMCTLSLIFPLSCFRLNYFSSRLMLRFFFFVLPPFRSTVSTQQHLLRFPFLPPSLTWIKGFNYILFAEKIKLIDALDIHIHTPIYLYIVIFI